MAGVILWAEHRQRERRRLWQLFLAAVAEDPRRAPYLLYAPVVIDPRKAFRITGLGI